MARLGAPKVNGGAGIDPEPGGEEKKRGVCTLAAGKSDSAISTIIQTADAAAAVMQFADVNQEGFNESMVTQTFIVGNSNDFAATVVQRGEGNNSTVTQSDLGADQRPGRCRVGRERHANR